MFLVMGIVKCSSPRIYHRLQSGKSVLINPDSTGDRYIHLILLLCLRVKAFYQLSKPKE